MTDLRQIADRQSVMKDPVDKTTAGEPRYCASQMRDMFVAGFEYAASPANQAFDPITGKTSTVDALAAAWSGDHRSHSHPVSDPGHPGNWGNDPHNLISPMAGEPSADYQRLYADAKNDLTAAEDECDRLNRIIDGLIR